MSLYQEFNQQIKDIFRLFKDLPSQQYRSKLHISEMQSKLVQGMNAEEKYAMTFLGPLVWRARNEFKDGDADFFLRRRYDVDLQQLSREHKFNYDNAVNTVSFMKDAYKHADAQKQTQIMNLLRGLVATYGKFLLEVNKSNNK